MTSLVFQVVGVAQPKGNMRALQMKGMKYPIVTESNRNVRSWSQLVAEGASHAIQALPEGERGLFDGPVRLSIAFYLPAPKVLVEQVERRARARRRGLIQTRDLCLAHLKAPDIDKCCRAIGDALSAVVYRDDSQVVELLATKAYALTSPPHVAIRVEPTAGVEAPNVPPAPLPLFEGGL